MDITVSARHMEISSALREAADEKIGRLSRFLDGMLRAEVHFSEERNPRIPDKETCEVTLIGPRDHIRAKGVTADPFAALDMAVSKLEQQLRKLKVKNVLRTHQGPRRNGLTVEVDEAEIEATG